MASTEDWLTPGMESPPVDFAAYRRRAKQRQRTHTRLSAAERGYDKHFGRAKRAWRKVVNAGHAYCCRCGGPIEPGSLWDLGHDDDDRSIIRGPEHQGCNRRAGARKAGLATARNRRIEKLKQSRRWL